MPTLFKRRNGIWYVVYNDGDRRRWLSTSSLSLEEAKTFYNENKVEFEKNNVISLNDLSKEICEYVKTNYSLGTYSLYKLSFVLLERIIGNKSLKLITAKDIEKFKQVRLKEVSPTTINIQFRTLKAAFNKALKLGLIEKNPFILSENLKVPRKQPEYISKKDFRKLLTNIQENDFKKLIIFAVLTMMRLNEILNLEFQDLDFTRRLIHVRNKKDFRVKNSKPRVIPMSNEIYSLLKNREGKSGFVFTNREGKQLVSNSVSRKFKNYIIKCKLSRTLHFHSLRHTGASWLINENVPLYDVQQILGHSSPTVTQLYAHLSSENLRKSIERISVNPSHY